LQALRGVSLELRQIHDVAVLAGSLRRESYSRKVARALIDLAPAGLRLRIVDLSSLAFYNEDEEAEPPLPWLAFRTVIAHASAVLFVTSEYNRSIPNALDVGSRPVEQSVWNDRPGGIISLSADVLTGFGANQHLRESLAHLNVRTMTRPDANLYGPAQLFDHAGVLQSDAARASLRRYLEAFLLWSENSPTAAAKNSDPEPAADRGDAKTNGGTHGYSQAPVLKGSFGHR